MALGNRLRRLPSIVSEERIDHRIALCGVAIVVERSPPACLCDEGQPGYRASPRINRRKYSFHVRIVATAAVHAAAPTAARAYRCRSDTVAPIAVTAIAAPIAVAPVASAAHRNSTAAPAVLELQPHRRR